MRFILGFNEHYIVNVKIQNRTVFGFSFLCMCVMFIQENVTSWRETWIYICFKRKKKTLPPQFRTALHDTMVYH